MELIVALHRVFRSPRDKLVFDVGHQAYAHKLLTGRHPQMGTLRQAGGIAPLLDRRESPHDAFGAGHACTALSAALGFAEAQAHLGEDAHAVAVLGDAALTGGLTFEALNHLADAQRPRHRLGLVLFAITTGVSIGAMYEVYEYVAPASADLDVWYAHDGRKVLHLIEGRLRVEPFPELGFVTVLELTTGRAVITPSEG